MYSPPYLTFIHYRKYQQISSNDAVLLIKNWKNFYKKYKILGGFHKIKDQMLVSMTLYIFQGTSPSSGVQMYTE